MAQLRCPRLRNCLDGGRPGPAGARQAAHRSNGEAEECSLMHDFTTAECRIGAAAEGDAFLPAPG